MAIIFKAFCAVFFGNLGLWLWRKAKAWEQIGLVPVEWLEDCTQPIAKGEPGFRMAVIWQKFIAGFVMSIAGLLVLSVVFELVGLI